MRVLLVEDDELLGDGIQAGLILNGFTVEWLRDGAQAMVAVEDESFDLLVLDLGLPRMDGLRVLKNMRDNGSNLPCLVITARDAVGDRVAGLDAGADDYLPKPFALEELAARLRALYRRPPVARSANPSHGDLSLDVAGHRVHRAGQSYELPRREFVLLQSLLSHQGKIFSRQELESRIYGWDDDISSNAVEVHVHALRQRFGKQLIRTVRGAGYVIDPLP